MQIITSRIVVEKLCVSIVAHVIFSQISWLFQSYYDTHFPQSCDLHLWQCGSALLPLPTPPYPLLLLHHTACQNASCITAACVHCRVWAQASENARQMVILFSSCGPLPSLSTSYVGSNPWMIRTLIQISLWYGPFHLSSFFIEHLLTFQPLSCLPPLPFLLLLLLFYPPNISIAPCCAWNRVRSWGHKNE